MQTQPSELLYASDWDQNTVFAYEKTLASGHYNTIPDISLQTPITQNRCFRNEQQETNTRRKKVFPCNLVHCLSLRLCYCTAFRLQFQKFYHINMGLQHISAHELLSGNKMLSGNDMDRSALYRKSEWQRLYCQ